MGQGEGVIGRRASSGDAQAPTDVAPAVPPSRAGPLLHGGTVRVVILVIVLAGALAWGARALNNSNENRLLRQRVVEAGSVLSAVLPVVQTPLASAAEVAEATNADRANFQRVTTPLIGPGRVFVSVAIWPVHVTNARPLLVNGATPALDARPVRDIQALLTRATKSPQLIVVGLLNSSEPRVAYAVASAQRPVRYVAYAESALPKNRTQVVQRDSAFSDLNYALYLGSAERAEKLLAASTPKLPLRGRQEATTVAFGDNKLRLVIAPISQLGGTLPARLPWLLLAFGLVLAFAAAAETERLMRERERAQHLADELGKIAEENSRLYAAQRTVAQTLQHSLLPDTLPEIPGIALAVRYVPGVAGVDIGGDWYDAMPISDGRVLIVVGDVSGRGLEAGIVMASLRYAIRAYAAQGDGPSAILTKLAALLDVANDGHFATVLCAVVDVDSHEVTLANAGHPEPLLLDGEHARFVRMSSVGVPVGVHSPAPYASTTLSVAAGATLLAYTDGLIERRGEQLDAGLQRLRDAATGTNSGLEELLTKIVDDLTPEGSPDDIAILGVRWTS